MNFTEQNHPKRYPHPANHGLYDLDIPPSPMHEIEKIGHVIVGL